MEIGFNAGHSAENFFTDCPDLKLFVTFDLVTRPYTPVAVQYFLQNFKERFHFIKGNSLTKVPEYAQKFPNEKFDLIYIDGNHAYEYCLRDIINCEALATVDTLLWVDDYLSSASKKAVDECEKKGVIKIISINPSWDSAGERCWVEARYLFK